MPAIHRYLRRTSLEFLTYPQGTSTQSPSAFRLSDVDAEEHPDGAHASQCSWRPSQTAGEETANAALTPGFVFSTSDVMPSPAPVVKHSAGASQTVARLRAVEVRLQNLEPKGAAAQVTMAVTIVWSDSLTTLIPLETAKGGEVATACVTFPPGKAIDGFLFYVQNPSLKKAEFTILAIGDEPAV